MSKSLSKAAINDEGYRHLLKSEDDASSFEGENGTDQHSPKSRTIRVLIVTLKTILVLFAVWGVFNVGTQTRHAILHSKPVSCSCGGTTVAEAKARGCIFTPLAIA